MYLFFLVIGEGDEEGEDEKMYGNLEKDLD